MTQSKPFRCFPQWKNVPGLKCLQENIYYTHLHSVSGDSEMLLCLYEAGWACFVFAPWLTGFYLYKNMPAPRNDLQTCMETEGLMPNTEYHL